MHKGFPEAGGEVLPMRLRPTLAAWAAVLALVPVLSAPAGASTPIRDGRNDAVVVAVIDSGFTPYHWNYLAAKMPQAQDQDPSNDLPLRDAPDTWLPGFPDPSGFASYSRLDLTLDETNPNRSLSSLQATDAATWAQVQTSTAEATHLYWLPGTKVVGMVDFEGNDVVSSATDHGAGTSSVAVGNLHGTCPECLLVFITYNPCPLENLKCAQKEDALTWAMQQPWIDVITNSYGFSTGLRDRIYDGSDTAIQRQASERGQTIFFSSGNGQANTFTVPNSTLMSSQEGPDWIVTVGGVSPSGGDYSGAGKPADVASVGGSYPSIGGTTVSSSGTFSGTSNATPVVAGMYGRTLYRARRALPGNSRIQQGGVIADQHPDPDLEEEPFVCGETRPDCELSDGLLTAPELRTRLFHGAVHTPQGLAPTGVTNTPVVTQEQQFLHEGHGSYFARLNGTAAWQSEEARIVDPLLGQAQPMARPAGERDWMIVDSYCRQRIWRPWSGGYFRTGQNTLPPSTPDWPIRTALYNACAQGYEASELPNLVPLPPFDVGIGNPDPGTSGTALRLSVSTANRGLYGLELSGMPEGDTERTFLSYQCVMWAADRTCQARRPVGRFVYHQTHLHYHFQDYAKYELRTLLPDGTPDMSPSGLAADGGKAAFCLLDYDQDQPSPSPIYSQPHPLYLTCSGGFSGLAIQGISPYWRDTYVSSLDGQQILIDDVPDGRYAVVIIADPDDRLFETDETDNVSFTPIELKNGAVTTL